MLKWGLVAFFLSLVAHVAGFAWIMKIPEATLPVAEYRMRMSQQVRLPGEAEVTEGLVKLYAVPGDPSLVRVPSKRQEIVYGASIGALLLSSVFVLLTLLYMLVRWVFMRR